MISDEKLLGCTLDSNGNWIPTGNAQIVLKADLDKLVMGDTLLECKVALEQRFPAEDSRLTRVFAHRGHRAYCERHRNESDGGFSDSDYFNILGVEEQCYAGGNAEEALALVKKYGTIGCASGTLTLDAADWGAEGCICSPNERGWLPYVVSLRYSPKAVGTARKAAATRQTRRAVLAKDIAQCTWDLYKHVREFLPLPYEHAGTYSRYSVCCNLLHAIKWFNFCFGKSAHRRHHAFQKLKSEWRQRLPATEKAYRDSSTQYCDARLLSTKLCNLMVAEIAKRNAPLNKSDKWTPLREPEDFHEYTDCVVKKGQEAKGAKASKSIPQRKSRSAKKR